jgi:hypothetical protein
VSTETPDLLPSPLNYDDRFSIIKTTAPKILQAAQNVMEHLLMHPEIDIRLLPAFHTVLCLTAYKAIHQSSLADSHDTTSPSQLQARERLPLFRRRLTDAHPQIRALVEGIDQHDRPDAAWREAMAHSDLWEGFLGGVGIGWDGLFWPDLIGVADGDYGL